MKMIQINIKVLNENNCLSIVGSLTATIKPGPLEVDPSPETSYGPSLSASCSSSSNYNIVRPKYKVYKCDFQGCEKTYSSSEDLDKHRRIHTVETGPFEVDPSTEDSYEPSLSCSNSSSPDYNIERPKYKVYKCDFQGCEKKYSRSGQLSEHRRTHTGERPYACTWEGCTWKFTKPSKLKLHYSTHTGQKPFKCQLCQRSFARLDYLTKHKKRCDKLLPSERKPIVERPYACNWEGCTWKFSRPEALKRHYKIHTGQKPFECHLCHQCFPLSYYLTRHMKKH